MSLSINRFSLPSNCVISFETTNKNEILFSKIAKDLSAPIVKNRAWMTLNAIKSGIEGHSEFIFDKDLKTEKISDVAQAIYSRYETQYKSSYWQSFIDMFTCCFGGKSDLEKMQDLLNEILHSSVDVKHLNPLAIEDSSSLSTDHEQENWITDSNDKKSEKSDQKSFIESESDHEEPFERSDKNLTSFLFENVFLQKSGNRNSSTFEIFDNLTTPQIQRLVELNSTKNFLAAMLDAIRFVYKYGAKNQRNSSMKLFIAFYQNDPNSPLWDAFQLDPCLTAQKTISILNRSLQESINVNEQNQLVNEIRLSFQPINHGINSEFELYTHFFLAHIINLNKEEGSNLARLKLKIFILAIIPVSLEDVVHKHTFALISRATHLDSIPVSECCQHLPITQDFQLTPFILKTLIAEYAKDRRLWNYYFMGRINTPEQAICLIEAALELPEEQKCILLSAIYDRLKFHPKVNIKNIFEERSLDPENFPSLPVESYNELFRNPNVCSSTRMLQDIDF